MKLTIIAIILCVSLGAKAQQDSTEMKKAIDAMQKCILFILYTILPWQI